MKIMHYAFLHEGKFYLGSEGDKFGALESTAEHVRMILGESVLSLLRRNPEVPVTVTVEVIQNVQASVSLLMEKKDGEPK